MIEPTDKDIGRAVVYQHHPTMPREDGIVTSFNEAFVFVRYKGDAHSKATRREELTWVTKISEPASNHIKGSKTE